MLRRRWSLLRPAACCMQAGREACIQQVVWPWPTRYLIGLVVPVVMTNDFHTSQAGTLGHPQEGDLIALFMISLWLLVPGGTLLR